MAERSLAISSLSQPLPKPRKLQPVIRSSGGQISKPRAVTL
tara:strand:+ start:418 stop:540 length:123 start_codon:yes stop_codon:yes gene_type:complete